MCVDTKLGEEQVLNAIEQRWRTYGTRAQSGTWDDFVLHALEIKQICFEIFYISHTVH